MSEETMDGSDQQVLAELRAVWSEVDPVPAGMTDRLKYAMTVRLLEAEVAELARMPELASRGGEAEVIRTMSFTGSRLGLMVSISEDSAGLRLDGWTTVPGAYVELQAATETLSATSDENGRFVLTPVPAGRCHFIIWENDEKDGRPTMTPTIDL